jgi:hypothetical protein
MHAHSQTSTQQTANSPHLSVTAAAHVVQQQGWQIA